MLNIEPETLYPESELITRFNLSFNDLARARKDGLQFKEVRRGKRFYMGQWLINWLEKEPEKETA